uniref:RanBP2-type domain-containing protein n=1 Tax=Strigamia maritima TaxID=126957 RepID=T1ILF8_STRMM
MDHKKSPHRRSKRHSKLAEDNFWDCSVCTYRNSAEAFKCLMCDVRKGTSTRKPRINPQLVAQQAAQQYTQAQVKPKKESGKSEKKGSHLESKTARKVRPKLKNVDRSSAQHKAVTVNNVTVIITEFQPKRRPSTENTNSSGSCTTDNGNQSDSTSTSDTRNCDSHSDSRSS